VFIVDDDHDDGTRTRDVNVFGAEAPVWLCRVFSYLPTYLRDNNPDPDLELRAPSFGIPGFFIGRVDIASHLIPSHPIPSPARRETRHAMPVYEAIHT
jgi:hypothetical protein